MLSSVEGSWGYIDVVSFLKKLLDIFVVLYIFYNIIVIVLDKCINILYMPIIIYFVLSIFNVLFSSLTLLNEMLQC